MTSCLYCRLTKFLSWYDSWGPSGKDNYWSRGIYGKYKTKWEIKNIFFSTAVSLQVIRRQRRVYMPLNHKYFHKIFSFCVQFPPFLPPAWFLVAPLMQVREQPQCNLSILNLHTVVHIYPTFCTGIVLNSYCLVLCIRKVLAVTTLRLFDPTVLESLNILSVALQTVLQWAMLLKG